MIGKFLFRYSRAFYDYHMENKTLGASLSDLAKFEEILRNSKDLQEFLLSPTLPTEAKRRVVNDIVKKMSLCMSVSNFLNVLLDNRRLINLNEIIMGIIDLQNEAAGIQDATIFITHDFPKITTSKIVQFVERDINKKLQPNFIVDQKLIAGAKVKLKDRVYEFNLSNQLTRLKTQLLGHI